MADNQITYDDILKPTDSITKAINEYTQLINMYDDAVSKVKGDAKTILESVNKISGATKKQRESLTQAEVEAQKLEKANRQYKTSLSEAGTELLRLREKQKEQNQINRLTIKLNSSQEGSYNQLSAQYSLNKIRLNQMTAEQRANTKVGKDLESQTNDIYNEMKRLQEATGKYSLNVGNYTNSILDAIKEQVRLNDQLNKAKKQFELQPKVIKENQQAIEAYEKEIKALETSITDLSKTSGKSIQDIQNDFEDIDFEDVTNETSSLKDSLLSMPGAAGSAAGGIDGLAKSAKAFLANPLVLTITLIVAGLTGLYKLFTRTKSGADLLAKGGAYLDGVLSALVGIVDDLYNALLSAFENPKEAIYELGRTIRQALINQITGALDAFREFANAINALWTGDMEALKESAANAGHALIQMSTGMDVEQQKNFAKSLSETAKQIDRQADAFVNLKKSQLNAMRTNREYEKSIEELTTKEELLKSISDDATKSFKEREEARSEAAKLTKERATIEKSIAKANLELINSEVDLRKANGEQIEELLDKQLEAYKAYKTADRDYLLSVRDNEKEISQLKQDRLEKDLDILIDGFDNQLTINGRLLNDEKITFKERFKIIDKTKELFESSFAKQIETIQKFTGVQINSNDLIFESDAVVLNQKIRSLGLSEIIEGRLLEVIRDRRTATQDLKEAEQDLRDKEIKNRQDVYNAKVSLFGEEKQLRDTEIDLLITTEEEKTRLKLNAEKDRLNRIIKLNETQGKMLTDIQLDIMRNQIKLIDRELKSAESKKEYDLFSLAGLKLTDDEKAAVQSTTDFAISQVQNFLQAQIESANIAVSNADRQVEASQNILNQELATRNAGYAANVEGAQRELALAKATQEKALQQQREAQNAELQLQSIMQAGDLITASAKIWAQLGFPFAIPALGVMWGSFIGAKIKASQITKPKTYGDGGIEFLGGGTHTSGNDTTIGFNNGYEIKGERNEAIAVINSKNTAKYRGLLPSIVESLNKGVFEDYYGGSQSSVVNLDMQDMPKNMRKMANSEKEYIDGRGRRIVKYKNVKTIYNV